jgi:tetratricopeptide (TPR) repeat protein
MVQQKGGGNLVGKISSYLQIVSKDPQSTAFVPLSEAYRQIGLLDDALEAARLGTNMLPHFSPGFSTLGRILGQMGRIDEAMAAYARALSIDRQSQSALVGLARLHLVRGEREQAKKILLQAVEFHPQDEMIENMLVALDLPRPWQKTPPVAQVEATAVDNVAATDEPATSTAASAVERAVETRTSEPIPTATLAEIYAKQGLTDQAIRVYEEILRLEPDNATAVHRLAELRGTPIVAAEPESALPPVEAVPSPAPVQARESRPPLQVLESWLRAIQIRRAHVQ